MMLFATATPAFVLVAAVLILVFLGVLLSLGVRFIPNDRVGIVEKLWSLKGSVDRGNIMAGNGQAGYQAELLRGGLHFFKWHFQYRVHRAPLVTVPAGQDRLRLRARRTAADGEPDARPRGRLRQLPGRRRLPRQRRPARPTAVDPA
jgi:uncharacterized membrane protein YqiK